MNENEEIIGLEERSIQDERNLLCLSFNTLHGWLKHYDTLLVTITTFVSGIVLGFFALKIQIYNFEFGRATIRSLMEAAVLLVLLLFSSGMSIIMLQQVRVAWERITKIEQALGFYDNLQILKSESIFSRDMLDTPKTIPTFFKLSFAIHFILFLMVMIHPFIISV